MVDPVKQRWYKCKIEKEELSALMQRSDWRGFQHTVLFFALLIGLGVLAYFSIGTWWMIPAFFAYGTVYCFINHMMHETLHRTVYKTKWPNIFLHWIGCFLQGQEAVANRWSHLKHHKVTYLGEIDPEVEIHRPGSRKKLFKRIFLSNFFNPIPIVAPAFGHISDAKKDMVPQRDWNWMKWSARLLILGYALIIASCIVFQTILPLVFTIFARFYGAPLSRATDMIQHAGLEIKVHDHRLCCRTVYLTRLHRFLYWNMNYHIEHHMFPAVPFHQLPKMNALLKPQMPPHYHGIIEVYKEIIPTMKRQETEPDFHVTPQLPSAD